MTQSAKRTQAKVKTDFVEAVGVSDVGCHRPNNEDSIFVDPDGHFVLLADGMGGHERGEEASRTALEEIKKHFDPQVLANELQDITDGGALPVAVAGLLVVMDAAVNNANAVVYQRNVAARLGRFMGSTVVGLVFAETQYAVWFHVGDSRIYRCRQGVLTCLTQDHSARLDWERKGRVGERPKKNVITRAIGPSPAVSATTGWDALQSGDMFLLCSDGLTDMISEDQVASIMDANADVGAMANQLVDAAIAAGGKDNVSVVVCKTR